MTYAKFTTHDSAQAYADAIQAELSKNPAYIATRWSDVIAGSDGYFYVAPHECVPTSISTPSGTFDADGNEIVTTETIHETGELPTQAEEI